MRKVSLVYLLLIFFSACAVLISCKHASTKSAGLSADEDSSFGAQKRISDFWNLYHNAQQLKAAHEFFKAREAYKSALDLNPRHEDALFNYGNMCYETGNFREAKNSWEKLLQVNPMNARAHYQLGNLYLDPDGGAFFIPDSAEREFKKALDLNREVTGPLLHLGQVCLIKNEYDQADKYFLAVTGTNPRGVEAYFQRGFICWERKEFRQAGNYFADAVKIARPEKRQDTIPIEGDTKEGKSFKRPSHESIFHDFFSGINGLGKNMYLTEMNKRYREEATYINKLRKIGSPR